MRNSHDSLRRFLALGGLTLAGTAILGGPGVAAVQSLLATPRQAEGPFYPLKLPLDDDNDLATVRGAGVDARGHITHIHGRVLNPDGKAVAGAAVEIWQCDFFGHYHHTWDVSRRSDPGFQGFGRTVSGLDGEYRFRTIRPVPYVSRTPHIHFAVMAPGFRRLTTQMYVAGEPGNERDGIYNSIHDPELRATLTVPLESADTIEAGALMGRFDVVLGRHLSTG